MAVVDPTEVATAFSDLLVKEVRRCELFGRKLLQGSHYLGVVEVWRLEGRKVRLYHWMIWERMGWQLVNEGSLRLRKDFGWDCLRRWS